MADKVVADLRGVVALLRRARTAAEPRALVTRAWRGATKFRPLLDAPLITRVVTEFVKREFCLFCFVFCFRCVFLQKRTFLRLAASL